MNEYPRKRTELPCCLYYLLSCNGAKEANRTKKIGIKKSKGESSFLHCKFQPFLQLVILYLIALLVATEILLNLLLDFLYEILIILEQFFVILTLFEFPYDFQQ